MKKCVHYFIIYLIMNTKFVDGILHLQQLVWSQRLLLKVRMTLEARESQPWLTSTNENLAVPKGRTSSICTNFFNMYHLFLSNGILVFLGIASPHTWTQLFWKCTSKPLYTSFIFQIILQSNGKTSKKPWPFCFSR